MAAGGAPGFTQEEVREFLERELGKSEATSSFYWESEELEEAIDLITDAVAKAIAANNAKVEQERAQRDRMSMISAGL